MRPKWLERFFKQGVVEVALSGNLGFVPLDEVLRLLARAGQTGAVEVRGEDVRGRIFVTSKGVALATIYDDSTLRAHLVNSEFVDERHLSQVESGAASFESAIDKKSGLVDLLREMTVESVYQLTSKGSTFEVEEDAASPFASPKPFELESILDDAFRRGDEWAEVQSMLADMAGVIRMKRDLGDRDEVTLSRDAWRLLSELGSGSTISELAGRLGTTDFWTAKVAADMSARELLSVGDDEQDAAEAPGTVEAEDHQFAQETPSIEAGGGDYVDPNQSWWVEPTDDEEGAGSAADETVEEDAGSVAPSSRLGIFAHNRNGAASGPEEVDSPEAGPVFEPESAYDEVEEDTEAFLEKVFSELEQPEPESEGHGLLRRRRIGSIIQDNTGNED